MNFSATNKKIMVMIYEIKRSFKKYRGSTNAKVNRKLTSQSKKNIVYRKDTSELKI